MLGWHLSEHGTWVHPQVGQYRPNGTEMDLHGLHQSRRTWRYMQFGWWLHSRSRRDSATARELNLPHTIEMSDVLYHICKRHRKHTEQLAILCGGLATAATTELDKRPTQCPACTEMVIPSVQHMLWECSAYQEYRSHRMNMPLCPLESRLGWGPNSMDVAPALLDARLDQMAAIRIALRQRGHGPRKGEG